MSLEWRKGEQINHRLFFINSLLRKLNFLIPRVGFARPFPHVISHVKLKGRGIRTRWVLRHAVNPRVCNMRAGMGLCSKISWSTSSRP